jgi:hypothetical protein
MINLPNVNNIVGIKIYVINFLKSKLYCVLKYPIVKAIPQPIPIVKVSTTGISFNK